MFKYIRIKNIMLPKYNIDKTCISRELSLGQKRVKAEFNPAKMETVDLIKNAASNIIDCCEYLKTDLNNEMYINEIESSYKELYELYDSLVDENSTDEKLRIIDIAKTCDFDQYLDLYKSNKTETIMLKIIDVLQICTETSCMYGVKANFTN